MSGAMSWPFLRLYILVLLYFSANAILNVIIPLQGESLGASSTTIGLIMGAYMFTTMFFRPWAGRIIQKRGPIKVLRFILIINGFALILYTFTGLGGYLVARILQGVSTAFFSMALQIGIIDALPEKERSQGISYYSLFSYIPGIVGPVLALGIWQTGGMDYFTVVLIGIAVCTGVFGYTAKMDKSKEQPPGNLSEQNVGMFHSFRQLVQNRFLFRCSVLMLSASVVFGAITTFIPLYASQLPSGNAGVYLMLQAGTVVLTRIMLRKKIPSDGRWHAPFIMGTMFLLAVAAQCVSLAITGGAALLYVGAILMGIAQSILYPTLTTYLSFVLPQLNRNVLIGLFIATADLGVSLGGVLMGPIADLSSYSFMYMICAILGAVMIAFAYERRKPVTDMSVG
ncbi:MULTISPECIES: staphylopine family metallophore export MFS transporter CntE [unclassified Paenibacillus]|uniref:staphylopine family metallophore export MFS transporter CntE n=1 Tax=unclassified Paenibacillus TaxID=185978 RepID=UPI000423FA0D|nr:MULTISPECIES: MFS transporter [unclassified Paenibacillus]KGP79664.1 multidrug MFS transporter [Paenibacillus sp. MAEPY2]KGP84096.1 multidrug MFS transporter [Paenibacillus sp. MAEPY1]